LWARSTRFWHRFLLLLLPDAVKRVLAVVQIVALLAVVVVCVAVCVLLLQVRHALLDAQTQLQTITRKVALDLDEAHHVLLESGLTAMEARKASAEERAALPKLTAQASQTFTSLDAWMVAARNTTSALGESQAAIARSTVMTLQSLDATVRAVQPVLAQAQASIVKLETVEADLDAQVKDPAIAASLHNIDGTTAAMEASAQDVQQEVHAITHPGWAKRCWGFALDVAHVFNPL
jgi:hypothetical protein